MIRSACDEAGTNAQPGMSVEACGFTLANAKTYGSLQAAAAQHAGGGQRLGQAAPIPRHPARNDADCPSDLLRCTNFFWRRSVRCLDAGGSQPSGNAPKWQKCHRCASDDESDERFPEKPPFGARQPRSANQITPHAEGLPVPSLPENLPGPRRRPPARPHTPRPSGL